MDSNWIIQLKKHKDFGCGVVSSGTKSQMGNIIWRSPENLKACNEVAIESQEITSKSRILTVTDMHHAGGLLLQTLPAYTLDAFISVEKFNPWTFLKRVKGFTHTFLTPDQMTMVMKTKGFKDCDLTGIRILGGSSSVSWAMIEAFVSKGAIVQPNWGMSEVGPTAINIVFDNPERVQEVKKLTPGNATIMGDTTYISYRLSKELEVKGHISIKPNKWLKTGDKVILVDGILFYDGRL